jgi:hypothetical protein
LIQDKAVHQLFPVPWRDILPPAWSCTADWTDRAVVPSSHRYPLPAGTMEKPSCLAELPAIQTTLCVQLSGRGRSCRRGEPYLFVDLPLQFDCGHTPQRICCVLFCLTSPQPLLRTELACRSINNPHGAQVVLFRGQSSQTFSATQRLPTGSRHKLTFRPDLGPDQPHRLQPFEPSTDKSEISSKVSLPPLYDFPSLQTNKTPNFSPHGSSHLPTPQLIDRSAAGHPPHRN